jgi:hypothetical protein
MNLSRAHRRPFLLAGLALLTALAGASTVRGQGADPFRPYNRQYDPYTVPMGPTMAEPGQFVGGMPRSGIRGANQYQDYLDDLGAGRTPYYRSSVDPSFDPTGKREYRPNWNADRSYDQSQELVTRKYLAYFTEKDPKKRAALLRDYNQTRGKVARALATSPRRENQTRALDSAAGLGPEGRKSAEKAESKPRSSATDRASRSSRIESTPRTGERAIPPPPPLFGSGSSRASRTQRTPEDVLNRARRLNSDRELKPGANRPSNGRSSTTRQPAPESSAPN